MEGFDTTRQDHPSRNSPLRLEVKQEILVSIMRSVLNCWNLSNILKKRQYTPLMSLS